MTLYGIGGVSATGKTPFRTTCEGLRELRSLDIADVYGIPSREELLTSTGARRSDISRESAGPAGRNQLERLRAGGVSGRMESSGG